MFAYNVHKRVVFMTFGGTFPSGVYFRQRISDVVGVVKWIPIATSETEIMQYICFSYKVRRSVFPLLTNIVYFMSQITNVVNVI